MTPQIITTYLTLVNAVGFVLMLSDKRRARRGAWRIPEATLMTVALAGGSIGTIVGMYLVRHKTRHLKFTVGLPLIILLQILLIGFLIGT